MTGGPLRCSRFIHFCAQYGYNVSYFSTETGLTELLCAWPTRCAPINRDARFAFLQVAGGNRIGSVIGFDQFKLIRAMIDAEMLLGH